MLLTSTVCAAGVPKGRLTLALEDDDEVTIPSLSSKHTPKTIHEEAECNGVSGTRRMNSAPPSKPNHKKCGNSLTVNNNRLGIDDLKQSEPGGNRKGNKLDGFTDHRNHKSKWVHINVAGAPFILKRALLTQHPDTLLGSEEIQRYYRRDLSAYYFDRSREAFDAIVNYYLTNGQIPYFCDTLDEGLVTREFEYFKIPLNPRVYLEQEVEDKELALRANTGTEYWKSKLNDIINMPDSSRIAAVYAIMDCFLILVSVIFLVMETEPVVKDYFINEDNAYYYYLFGLNSAIMAFFTADYIARLWSATSKIAFLKQILPWLDLLSILPFYLELLILMWEEANGSDQEPTQATLGLNSTASNTTEIAVVAVETQSGSQGYVVLRVCRVFRVIRVFKLARRSENLLILLKAVGNTSTELFVLFIMVFMVVLMFGSIMYTVESTTSVNGTNFTSIMYGCWWSVITVTTVGYGDIYPRTTLGMFIGTLAVLSGLIILALPVTVIVAKFSEEYDKSKGEKGRRR